MDSIRNTMSRIIEKCDVCIDGNVISKELLIRTFSNFISSTIEEKRHNVGIVLHTGLICFDAILLAYAAISDILYNETNAAELVSSLQVGDMVLCYSGSKGKTKPSKWIFKGFVNSIDETPQESLGTYIVLQNDKKVVVFYQNQAGLRLFLTLEHQNLWIVEDFEMKMASDMISLHQYWRCKIQRFHAL